METKQNNGKEGKGKRRPKFQVFKKFYFITKL